MHQNLSIIGLLVVILCSGLSSCRYLRIRWEGRVQVPQKGFGSAKPRARWWGKIDEGVMIVMQSRPQHIVQLHFTGISKDSIIKVYVTKPLKRIGWRLSKEIVNVTESSFFTRGQRGVRIIAGEDANYTLRYFRGYCPVPDSVTTDSCTKRKNRGSQCEFKCKSPQYHTVKDFSFKLKCRANRSWRKDFSEYCISKVLVGQRCLNLTEGKGRCPLSSEQLVAIYSEQRRENEPSRSEINFLALTLRGSYSQYTWSLPAQPTVVMGSPNDPQPERRTIESDCFGFCIIDAKTRDYKVACGSQPTTPSDLMTLCLMCRYSYDVCSQHVVVA